MRTRTTALLLAPALAVTALAAVPAQARQSYPFQNPRLSVDARVNDLAGRLTLDEKISLLHQYQPAIPRLGIKRFKTGTEALHGLAWSTDVNAGGAVRTASATVFPQSVGLGATWNPDLLKKVGSAVGDEARGYNKENSDVWGLQLWAPVVNLLRDPRWGRNEEGYSEDPLLSGLLGTAYGKGMQGDHPKYLKAAPVVKHYLANNNEVRRDTTSSSLRPRVKKEYDEVPFKLPLSADAATGVMTAYNLINGRPATAHADANDLVRAWASKTLFNVTDAGGPNNLVNSQKYYGSLAEADAATIKAGVDSFTTDDTNSAKTIAAVKEALDKKYLAERDVDTAVRHILSIRVRLGEFDPDGGPYAKITKSVVNSPAHQRLARQAATEQTVLLKNQNGALPLDAAKNRKVAVVGPLADTLYTDWYSGALPYKVTPLAGIRDRLGSAGTVTGSEGADRIALKDAGSGRYVTAGTGAAGAPLKLSAEKPGAAEQFDVFDWGQGVVTLRSVANGKTVGRFNWGDTMVNDQDQPNGWFVQQMFKLERDGDGVLLRYAGYEKAYDWAEPAKTYLKAGDDGTLVLAPKGDATRFTREVVRDGVDEAVKVATGADTAVVVVGSMPFINGREDHDRTTMALAERQSELIKAVRKANPNTVVIVENSYPTTLTWEQDNVPALLWTSHAGAETGNALASVLFGDASPSGRLPQTWYRSENDLPDILEYDIIKTDRTYLYFKGKPLYPFGHGLSYGSFRYGKPRLSSRSTAANGTVTVQVPVTNTSRTAADEVVQLYTHQRTSRVKQPVKQLRAFQKVHLKAGQTRAVTLKLRAADLAHWDVTRNRWTVEKSTHDLLIGSSSADIRQRATLAVRGERIPARDLTKPTRAADFDDQQNALLVDESKVRGDAVGADSGGWIKFAGADLGRGVTGIKARAAREAEGGTTVQVRLDRPDGPLAGTLTIPSTGDRYAYREATAALTGATGRRDVYLVFGGDARLSSFALTR
ncbi:glycoside hydrolase family 3 protein [Actinomadura kijaniata]|uniref:Exo-alpha-(1->6)-L-arabinopyranosidase n=1 Tax=Actinomadura namibiensis TaxID=182080 RepID=A0A7W3QM18_ACTNM|nr:glycoside hydrolase family 3 C-terminal domain-containing protein [Actinomadura namibiensis]MBA8952046.1 beta-glucosidase [Actinomadura namibiensis]